MINQVKLYKLDVACPHCQAMKLYVCGTIQRTTDGCGINRTAPITGRNIRCETCGWQKPAEG